MRKMMLGVLLALAAALLFHHSTPAQTVAARPPAIHSYPRITRPSDLAELRSKLASLPPSQKLTQANGSAMTAAQAVAKLDAYANKPLSATGVSSSYAGPGKLLDRSVVLSFSTSNSYYGGPWEGPPGPTIADSWIPYGWCWGLPEDCPPPPAILEEWKLDPKWVLDKVEFQAASPATKVEIAGYGTSVIQMKIDPDWLGADPKWVLPGYRFWVYVKPNPRLRVK